MRCRGECYHVIYLFISYHFKKKKIELKPGSRFRFELNPTTRLCSIIWMITRTSFNIKQNLECGFFSILKLFKIADLT